MTEHAQRSRRRYARRALPVVAAAAMVAMGLSGCAAGTSTSIDSGAPASRAEASSASTPTVTLWSWDSGNKGVWTQVQKDLAKEGTKVNISFRTINPTSYDSVVQTAMNGGSGPDIFYDRAGEGTQTYAAAKLIAPLNGIIDTKNLSSSALATASYDGKVYGVPDSADTMEVFYNKTVLADNHISVPKTWTEFISDMKKLKSAGVTPMYVMGVQQWMLALQLDAVAASTLPPSYIAGVTDKKDSYTGAPYVKALTAFQQLSPYLESNWQAVGSADNEQETALGLGNCAFVIDGIFDVDEMKQANPSVKLGQFLVPSPDGQKAKVDWYPDANFSMNSKISNPAEKKAAEKIIQFTTTKTFGNIWDKVTGTVSPISGATIPKSNALASQAATWYDTTPISSLWGIRSDMDTPAPDTASLKSTQVASSIKGIFEAEQNIAVPLLEHKLTPKQAAAQVQKAQQWYFQGSN
jgi:multiple sugar transport system substrate-binding protein/raffinose/stachyose/melibiose transport system substrate-binding protein